jgi:hypothetical protein
MTFIKTVLCGFLPNTVSARYHPVQNIILNASDHWSRAEICFTDTSACTSETGQTKPKTLYTIGNIPGMNFNIFLTDTANYQIALYVNDKMIMESKHLFYVEVKVHVCSDASQNLDFITYEEARIDDN